MTNAGNKKLLALLVTLVLLAAGLIAMGSTFATQVDLDGKDGVSTDSGFNVIVNAYENGQYSKTLQADAAFFTSDASWCPGYTQILYFSVTNNEAFPVKTAMNMNVTKSGFDNMLSYAVVPQDLKAEDAAHPDNWADFVKMAGESEELKLNSNTVFSNIDMAPGETRYYALGIHMSEQASSHYQNKMMDMNFSFRVDANSTPGSPAN